VAERSRRVREWIESGKARDLRVSAALSLAAAGRDVEVGPDTILRWERGDHVPRGRNVMAYYTFLHRLDLEAA
jgi:helix-turn-helix protein